MQTVPIVPYANLSQTCGRPNSGGSFKNMTFTSANWRYAMTATRHQTRCSNSTHIIYPAAQQLVLHSRPYLAFDEVAHDLVVEIVDRGPSDSFLNIFLLFRFQGQLDENLLQLLVDEVDAELLEAVFLHESESQHFGHNGVVTVHYNSSLNRSAGVQQSFKPKFHATVVFADAKRRRQQLSQRAVERDGNPVNGLTEEQM